MKIEIYLLSPVNFIIHLLHIHLLPPLNINLVTKQYKSHHYYLPFQVTIDIEIK